ncbi:DMT family transporter [Aurantiacibacter poecillastricola]|uniref:DMT family transporter n=1 Tax=Aurantiacibacter poecillastricola TaxID=3064385 RepID=UPI00273E2EA2|nr:DMT family transporter [Aurantiacibacter sp. 219JJ12-13]MDP5262584.1 DMT family transporter [Aurantiacibacter sp. 219JJ12-13]
MTSAPRDDSSDRPLLALLMRLAGIAGFALMAALIKMASDTGIHLAELLFWRQLVSLPILLGWALVTGGLMQLSTTRPMAHGVRAAYGVVGMVLNFGGVILLPLAEATTLSFTAPIFAVLLSIVLLKETVGIWRWSAVAAGFAGILVIAQPGGGNVPLFGAAVALGGAFMIALIAIQIRDLSRTETPLVIVFWFSVGSVIVTAPFMLFVHEPLTSHQWWLVIGIGLAGTWGQVLVTMALRLGKVSSVIVMDYSSIVWATLYGWLFFATLPAFTTWIGAPLVVLSGLIISWREHHLAKRAFVDQRQATGT